MHPAICKFVSESFYDGQLKTSETITPELRSSPATINEGKPLTFVNVPIAKGAETPGVSKSRKAEVDAISRDLKSIIEIDKEATVGIITFYSAQASKIRQSLEMILNAEESSRVEVGTVDAFQGKEFDYVMLSCVRSNHPKNEKPVVFVLEKMPLLKIYKDKFTISLVGLLSINHKNPLDGSLRGFVEVKVKK